MRGCVRAPARCCYRLGLAHDASVATALSAVTVSQPTNRSSRAVVGRDLEMDALLHEFERADRGKGRLVVLSAEAGIGKTTILDAFLRLLEDRGEVVRVGRGRCSERLAGAEAYLPVLEVLDSLQRSEKHGSLSRLLRALAPELVHADHAARGERFLGSAAGRRCRDRIAGALEARDRGAARRSHPHASGRALLRRRALGGSVDDGSDRLSRRGGSTTCV